MGQDREPGLLARLDFYWNHGKKHKADRGGNGTVLNLLRQETHRLIWDDPQLSEIFKNGNGDSEALDEKWFHFVEQGLNQGLWGTLPTTYWTASPEPIFLISFSALGSAGALYSVLAPYFVAFSIYSEDRHFGNVVLARFLHEKPNCSKQAGSLKVAHFTDTFYEVNGVAGTLKRQIGAALRAGKNYTRDNL